MKKRVSVLFVAAGILLVLSACGHTHQWQDASCTQPKTCAECRETEGNPLGHDWAAPTCTTPKRCGRCGEEEGKALGHTWTEATCTKPRTCMVCGDTEGDSLGHVVPEWTQIQISTCTQEGTETGTCAVCGESVRRQTGKTDHTPGEWEITVAPTKDKEGVRVQKCTVCGEELETESYSLSSEEIKEAYISWCLPFSYEEIARDPEGYKGTYGEYSGQIIQVVEDDGSYLLRVNITPEVLFSKTYYNDTICVFYTPGQGEPRLLEDDIVAIYGTNEGLYTYESVLGAKISVPLVQAEYVDYLW